MPAFAAVERHQQCRNALAARFEGQHAAIFVVGMGIGLHQAGGGLQAAQHQLQASGSRVLRDRLVIMIDGMIGRAVGRMIRRTIGVAIDCRMVRRLCNGEKRSRAQH